ncbi:hypothetical protein GCM10010404_64620 [Nonomuraea africana]|uniref:Uncharacterized protein n=1 Tax=Nonomuraea africana TaxID=46171 RepID=A0ABR9KHJ9_9ACTN|nr:hypothetical protein [Nonomuraea africana]MBE1561281.1 hypothetical protein [Nonomuraea africana]
MDRRDQGPGAGARGGRWAVLYKEPVSGSPIPGFKLLKRRIVPAALLKLSSG